MRYLKGEKVKITSDLSLKSRDYIPAKDEKEEESYLLSIGEIFECTDYSQPDYMEYLDVFCHKRNTSFTLPMEFVSKI